MRKWLRHERIQRDPPNERMRHVHKLHHTQSLPMLDERSAPRGNMPQRNDEEGGKHPCLSFSPAASVWGQMGRAWTTDGRNAPRTMETITEKDFVAFFHQFFGLTNNPAYASWQGMGHASFPRPDELAGDTAAWRRAVQAAATRDGAQRHSSLLPTAHTRTRLRRLWPEWASRFPRQRGACLWSRRRPL
jgi:hypothetical protein